MPDPLVRALVVGAVLALAVVVGVGARHLARWRADRVELDLSGLEGRVLFFSDAACVRCDVMRAHLDGLGEAYVEIAYDRQPEVHHRVGVTAVPLLVVRDAAGREVQRFAGVASRARLAVALRNI